MIVDVAILVPSDANLLSDEVGAGVRHDPYRLAEEV